MDKKGVSEVVGYVLLISITLALSVMVYSWLTFYVSPHNVKECPDTVSLVVSNYNCSASGLNLTLKNNGLFDVKGYVVRVNNRSESDSGFYVLNKTGSPLAPGKRVNVNYSLKDVDNLILTNVNLVEVQPFVEDGGTVYCKSFATQKVNCP